MLIEMVHGVSHNVGTFPTDCFMEVTMRLTEVTISRRSTVPLIIIIIIIILKLLSKHY